MAERNSHGRGCVRLERHWGAGLLSRASPGLPPAVSTLTRALALVSPAPNPSGVDLSVFGSSPRLGGIDTYGIELLPPRRYGRSRTQWGRKGVSTHRWIVGGKLCLLLHRGGLVVGWSCGTAKVYDPRFHPRVEMVKSRLVVLADQRFQAAAGEPPNLKLCRRGQWNDRMWVETVFSMMTLVSHLKQVRHRCWDYLLARLAFMVTAVNTLLQWNGLPADEQGFVHLSMAEFSL